MEKIGIYGGTFNPIHNGHLHLLQAALDRLRFDRVLVIPTNIPPHKVERDLASNKDRLEMVRLAVEGMDRVDMEQRAKGKSYTILTVKKLRAMFPGAELTLLMGADMLLSFDRWHRWREILALASLAAFARSEGETELLERKAAELGNARVVRVEPLPMSSTMIREMIRRGEDISALVPEKVCAYLREKRLYQE